MPLIRHLVSEGHVHRFAVVREPQGWEVREEEDSATVRCVHRHDWHSVERDTLLFDLKALELKREGWVEH